MSLSQAQLDIIDACEPKIQEAESTGKFLAVSRGSVQVVFSPESLRRQQAEGKFCWGAENFSLVDQNDPHLKEFGRYL